MVQTAVTEIIATIEAMLQIHPREENFEHQFKEVVNKLFDLLDPNINAIKIDGQVYFREEFLRDVPTLESILKNLL